MARSILQEKSYAFSLRIVKLHDFIVRESKAYALANQIVRSGTSIGANVMEASQAESRSDFIHKLSISNKEAFETEYWLCLLRDTGKITSLQAASIIGDCKEIQKLLTSSIKTAKART